MYVAPSRPPAPVRVRVAGPRRPGVGARRRTSRHAHARLPGLREPRPQPGRGPARGAPPASSTSTTTTTTPCFGDVNLVVPEASSTAEVVWDLMHDLGVHADASRSRRRLYVGLVTDTGRFMYTNTGVRAARDGRRARRRRASTCTRRSGACTRGCPSPRSRCWRVRCRRHGALRRRPADVRDARPRRLRADRRAGLLHRGHHRPPPGDRRHEGRGADAVDPAGRRRRRSARRCRCARPTARSTCRRSPVRAAAAGTARRPASPPSSEPDEIVAFLRAEIAAQLAQTAR